VKQQYFLADFCYWANLLLLVYMWLFPWSETLFAICFALANGPLFIAVALFRNSLVFHSVDHQTSLLIHCVPCFCSYIIRWHNEALRVPSLISGTDLNFAMPDPATTGFYLLWTLPLMYFHV